MKKVPCEIYSRIVGYFRPVQNWNLGKREEFKERRVYGIEASLAHPAFTPDERAMRQLLVESGVIRYAGGGETMKRNDDLADLYRSMAVSPVWSGPLSRTVSEINASRKRYQVVSAKTGVPWQVIAALHRMEASGNFSRHLHNGDPLTARTQQVPAGRPEFGQPPFTWEESAADALDYDGLTRHKWNTDIGVDLLKIEMFNGAGYRNRKLNSPYLWSGTQWYDRGKYVADGKFDPSAVSKQLGAAPILKALAF